MIVDINRIEGEICSIEKSLLLDPSFVALQGALKCCLLDKTKLLTHKEETLRQKSRAIWLQAGDENSKYFHNYENRIRISNLIWETMDDSGNLVTHHGSIKDKVISYFSNLYKDSKTQNISEQLKVLNLFQTMFSWWIVISLGVQST